MNIIDLIYPRRCPVCHDIVMPKGQLICPACEKKLIVVREPRCKKCSKKISGQEQELCYDCAGKKHYYTQGVSVFTYNDEMKNSIYQYKYHGKREYADYYIRSLIKYGEYYIRHWRPQLILPIPLHPKKQKERGFNQAEILARGLEKQFQIQLDTKLLIRKKYTTPQKELGNQARKKNLRNTFAIKSGREKVKRVLVVDDIYTTGSTIDEAARILRKWGASEIYFITLSIPSGA